MELKQGSLLKNGEYRIEKVLGQGGFGITYLGVQTGLNRKVAIKEFFMKDFCNRDENTSRVSVGSQGSRDLVERFRQKFIKEAQTIATLENPHIVSIHDIFEENGTAYYVMKHVSGGSLKEYVEARGKLPESEALKFIRQIADALAYIHEQKILHLDVKPANVLLDERTHEAILIDFGISKHYDEAGGQTSSSPAGISKGYAPLEQYNQGGVDNFLPCTDIYSLGATLYFMLTGQVPPEAISLIKGLPVDVLRVNGIGNSIINAITQSMKLSHEERPQSVAEFLAMLDGIAPTKKEDKEVTVEVEPFDQESTIIPTSQLKEKVKEQPNEPQEEKKPATPHRSRKGLWIGIGVAAVCLVAITIYLVNQRIQEEERQNAILADFYDYTITGDSSTYKVAISSQFKEQLNRASGGSLTSNGYTWRTGDALPNPAPNGMYRGVKVTDMSFMFNGCSSLKTLDLSNFNTANVTNMNSMFLNCIEAISIDVSSFNTSNVMDMSGMFAECENLVVLDLSNFKTYNVTNMCAMFVEGRSLTSLNVSSFETPKVTNMSGMFAECESISSLNLNKFNISRVENMSGMFSQCSKLTEIDLSSFQIGSNVNTKYMFSLCSENCYGRVIGYVKDQATAYRLNNNYNTGIDTNKLYFTTK